MKPSQLASRLLRIAATIEASERPHRSLVSRDLRRVLAAMDDSNWHEQAKRLVGELQGKRPVERADETFAAVEGEDGQSSPLPEGLQGVRTEHPDDENRQVWALADGEGPLVFHNGWGEWSVY